MTERQRWVGWLTSGKKVRCPLVDAVQSVYNRRLCFTRQTGYWCLDPSRVELILFLDEFLGGGFDGLRINVSAFSL